MLPIHIFYSSNYAPILSIRIFIHQSFHPHYQYIVLATKVCIYIDNTLFLSSKYGPICFQNMVLHIKVCTILSIHKFIEQSMQPYCQYIFLYFKACTHIINTPIYSSKYSSTLSIHSFLRLSMHPYF